MARAQARHILVETEDKARDLKQQIEDGASFERLAAEHSICTSKEAGGDLGDFGEGDMVPGFDRVVFGDLPVGQTSEPVKTEFGYHLIQVEKRV
jgi:peptidyl-prolyl cis-trans isomerase C